MEEDTVELNDYLRVIWKRKVFIISGTLIYAIIVGGKSFLSPNVYKFHSVIVIGSGSGAIESPVNLIATIEKALIYNVMEELNISEDEYLSVDVENPESTLIVEVNTQSSNINRALNIFKELNTIVINDHKKIVEERNVTLKNEIEILSLKQTLLRVEKHG